jgi:hypothetical protein
VASPSWDDRSPPHRARSCRAGRPGRQLDEVLGEPVGAGIHLVSAVPAGCEADIDLCMSADVDMIRALLEAARAQSTAGAHLTTVSVWPGQARTRPLPASCPASSACRSRASRPSVRTSELMDTLWPGRRSGSECGSVRRRFSSSLARRAVTPPTSPPLDTMSEYRARNRQITRRLRAGLRRYSEDRNSRTIHAAWVQARSSIMPGRGRSGACRGRPSGLLR